MARNSKKVRKPGVWLGPAMDGDESVPAAEVLRRSPRRSRGLKWRGPRINRRAFLILVGLTAAVVILCFPARWLQDRSLRRSALAQARRLYLEEKKVDQALVNVDAYLETWPDDLPGLELKGELMAKVAYTPQQILAGIQALDGLLRLDPDPPARQEDRKRLVELSVRLGDMVRAGSERAKTTMDRFEVRYRFANKIAEQRIKLGADDAEARRLLGTTLERLSDAGDAEAGAEAIKEYQKALRRDQGDFASAERLAALRIDRRKDQAGADQILDNLIKARPRSVEARLVRARHLLKTGREERAKADVDAASRLDSTDKGVRLMAASLSLRRGDPSSARRHLAAIPEAARADSRLDVLLAQLEFAERRPEQAIKTLREGLLRSSGTDRELTWRLAYWLIQLGRPEDARPLMAQFRRLCGRQDHPMLRLLEGSLREKAGRHASAIAELEPAREEIDGEWKGELEMILGRCHEAVGDVEAAEADYIKARDLSPASTAPRQSLARLLLGTDPDRGLAELTEGLRLAPNSAPLLADLATAQMARQFALPADRRDWSAAQAAAEKASRAKPDDPMNLRVRARLLAAMGKVEQADSALEEATRGPCRGVEDAWMARAQSLEARGRLADALAVLEQAARPDASGDTASLRAARASLRARTGHGRAALALVAVDVQKYSTPDRAILAREKAKLLLALGDRKGARLALLEWAGLAPEDSGPGLMMVEMARRGGTAEELEQGVAILRKVGGDDEPVSLSAQAIAILLPEGDGEAVSARLEEAESLSQRLQEVAPRLPITFFIRALILEQGSDFEEAILAYKLAIKGDPTGPALPRLVALLNRLKRVDELAALKAKATSAASAIDRMSLGQALGSGDKDQAEALLARLIEAEPDSLEYRADLARVLRDVGRPEQAEETLRDLVDRRPERPQPWLALLALQLERGDRTAAAATVGRLKGGYKGDRGDLLLNRCLWALGEKAEAARACERELANRPNDLALIQLASEVEEANGRLDRAEALIARARRIDPGLPWARRRMALILSSLPNHSRWAEARTLVEAPASGAADLPQDRMIRATVLERGPDPESQARAIEAYRSLAEDLPFSNPVGRKARFNLARLLLASGDRAGAAEAIVPATAESASPDPAMLVIAIEALALEGKGEEARLLLDRLTKTHPDAPSTVACRALVLKAEGDPSAATAALLEAAASVEKAPDGESLHRYYFDQLARLGPESAAEEFGRKMVARWPAQGSALARHFAALGRVDEALEAGRLAVDAGSPREPLRLALSLQALGRLEGAAADKACKLAIAASLGAAKDSEVLSMTAALLRKAQRFEDEAALYRKLLAADPANIVARNNLAWALGKDLDRPAEALVEVDRVIRQAGAIPQAVDTRGMILARLGRIDEAIADLEKATKVDPSAIHHIHLAKAYAQAGRPVDRQRSIEAARLATARPGVLEPEDLAELEGGGRR